MTRLLLSIITTAILLAGFTTDTAANPGPQDPPGIVGFKGETVPGVMTQMSLHWAYSGHLSETARFRIYHVTSPLDSILVAELPSTERKHTAVADPSKMSMNYRIVCVEGETLLSSAAAAAPVGHLGILGVLMGGDKEGDAGGQIELSWKLPAGAPFEEFRIYRTTLGEGSWKEIGRVEGNVTEYTDQTTNDGAPYNYMLRGLRSGAIFESPAIMNLISAPAWFDWGKINLLIIAIVVLAAITLYMLHAEKSDMLYIRKIAGLQAVEEAVGRATEMGRSVLFIPGIQDLDDVQTIAGLNILGSVAKMTAQYETRLDVPVSRSLVMSNGREVVKQAYMSVGRPDFYNDDIVHYVTDEQFGYVAAIDGIMVREKPAACFYAGAFFAESLILAETGNHVGAIQIAGTAMPTQLPFFVAACDYTLIGEELFAASAYLSKDKSAIAALRGQDVGKAVAMGSIALGSILITLASISGGGIFQKLSTAWVRLFALNF
jgi:hypothetical protein